MMARVTTMRKRPISQEPGRPTGGFRDYEPLDHTADIGFVVRAASLEELFGRAARAMFAEIGTWGEPGELQEETLVVEGATEEDLLHDLLSELNYRHQVRARVYFHFRFQFPGPGRLEGRLNGRPIGPLDRVELEIKAVTYHGLSIIRIEDGFQGRVLFDV